MAKINYLIGKQGFERVRERLGEIITDELANQVTLDTQNPADINAKVWAERGQAFDVSELPAINIILAKGNFDNEDSQTTDGTYTFMIDAYSSAASKDGKDGDFLTALKIQRMIGIIREVLCDHQYRTLGFAPGFIGHVDVNNISFPDPLQIHDAQSANVGRLQLTVRLIESATPEEPLLIGSFKTSVKISTTNKGYLFVGYNY